MVRIIADARSRTKKKSEKDAQSVADNALSALVQILLNYSAALQGGCASLWSAWLGGLPCQEDEQEAERNHALLVEFVMDEKPEVVGAGGANLGQIMSILADIYEHDEMSNDEINRAIGQLVVKLAAAQALEPVAETLGEAGEEVEACSEETQGSAA